MKHDADWYSSRQVPCAPRTLVSHWFWFAGGHCAQAVVVQSTAQPVLWLQLALTNGATQLNRPVPSLNEKWNGERHAAQAGAVVSMKAK